ncbi:MAG TPA: RluA family pseudouridine synthase [Bacteroidales bacterium]|jgi:23S rRNA pseudouridine1911/1915/1917 synthase|nr:RluA family pseudouridine synthase [Bacteroidales bacterium]MBP7037714.1 RluA family pseudouridine synthase [Bacteroidales bacterium]MZP66544.1 RluA family pseudouridine synthase [Bacteroidales bacterium]NLK55574.1 RluA family pseudouridine synthase [Bacteroidales bacterium]HNY53090.1 RluA family pseudouridine synthase [Bacteroidales bacterium]
MTWDELTDQQELFEHFRFKSEPGQSLLRVDKFLFARLENTSRTRIRNAANAGNILVNNKPVKPNYRVKPGDLIQVVLPNPPREIELIPEDIPINIIYEDDDVIVVNKEAGMVVHPAYGNYTGTLVNALMWHFRDIPLFQTGELRPGLVHRIDKNTSGLLVVAKNELSLNILSKQFYERTTDRKYIALVWGTPDPPEGSISGNVGRNIRDRKIMQVFPDGSQGKPAITHYSVIEDLGYVSLVECKLETGRTHQIRVHFSYIKHPLFNDEEYGGEKILRGTTFAKYQQFVRNCFAILPRQALHAKSLSFDHPVTGKRLSFDSELPDDMKELIEKWREYTRGRE